MMVLAIVLLAAPTVATAIILGIAYGWLMGLGVVFGAALGMTAIAIYWRFRNGR